MMEQQQQQPSSSCSSYYTMLSKAARELEDLRRSSSSSSSCSSSSIRFPPACYNLMMGIAGNQTCVDCGNPHPDWASVSFGTLMCLNCSGRHRGFGVQTSFVRSIQLDSWTYQQILSMLEGGNTQLKQFFQRHNMDGRSTSRAAIADGVGGAGNEANSTTMLSRRYYTKAAQFYRYHLAKHIAVVSKSGVYRGRGPNRNSNNDDNKNNNNNKNKSTRRSAEEEGDHYHGDDVSRRRKITTRKLPIESSSSSRRRRKSILSTQVRNE